MTPNPTPATLAEISERHRVSAPYKPEFMQDYSQSVADYNRCRDDRATLLSMLEAGRDAAVDVEVSGAAHEVDTVLEGIPSLYDHDALFQRKTFLGNHEYEPLSFTIHDLRETIRALKSGAALSPAAVVTRDELERAAFMFGQLEIRMQVRVDSGKESVAIGQTFARDIVATARAGINLIAKLTSDAGGTGEPRQEPTMPPEQSVEEMIKEKGADVAPRITPQHIREQIKAEYISTAAAMFAGAPICAELGLLTICILVLQNGFTVVGKSACASPENFNAEVGARIAREDAVQQVWMLEGYLLRSRLAVGPQPTLPEVPTPHRPRVQVERQTVDRRGVQFCFDHKDQRTAAYDRRYSVRLQKSDRREPEVEEPF